MNGRCGIEGTALQLTTHRGYLPLIQPLLKNGAHIVAERKIQHCTLLWLKGNRILSKHCSKRVPTSTGKTANIETHRKLHHAFRTTTFSIYYFKSEPIRMRKVEEIRVHLALRAPLVISNISCNCLGRQLIPTIRAAFWVLRYKQLWLVINLVNIARL